MNMLTQGDFNKLVETFVTKAEFEQRIEQLEENMATKDEFRKVMNVLDKVLKEVLAMRQEQSIHVGDHMRIDERLTAVEQTPTVLHEIRQSKV